MRHLTPAPHPPHRTRSTWWRRSPVHRPSLLSVLSLLSSCGRWLVAVSGLRGSWAHAFRSSWAYMSPPKAFIQERTTVKPLNADPIRYSFTKDQTMASSGDGFMRFCSRRTKNIVGLCVSFFKLRIIWIKGTHVCTTLDGSPTTGQCMGTNNKAGADPIAYPGGAFGSTTAMRMATIRAVDPCAIAVHAWKTQLIESFCVFGVFSQKVC